MKIDYQNNTLDDLLGLKAQAKAWPIIERAKAKGVFRHIHQNVPMNEILQSLSDEPTEAECILDILSACGLVIRGENWICNAPLAERYFLSEMPEDELEKHYIESCFQKLCGEAKVRCIAKMSEAFPPEAGEMIAFLGAYDNDYGIVTALSRWEAYQNKKAFPLFSEKEVISFCQGHHLAHTGPISVTSEISAVFAASTDAALKNLSLSLEQCVTAAIKKLDFKSVTSIDPKDVVIAPWVKDHCRFGCSSYGSKHCPPFSPNFDETLTKIRDYHSALLIEGVPPTRDFQRLMLRAEKIAFKAGCYRAFAYWAGPCCICTECAPPPKPQKCTATRPSMESAGIDVFATVRKQGFQLETRQDKNDYVKYFGLLLLE